MSGPAVLCTPKLFSLGMRGLSISPTGSVANVAYDVLLEIFQLYLGENPYSFKLSSSKTGPWTMARVCKRWRELVNDSPVLWSRISLRFDSRVNFQSPAWMIPPVALYLERAGNAPLYLDIDFSEFLPSDVISALAASVARWSELRVRMLDENIVNLADLGFPCPAPLLKKVDLQTNYSRHTNIASFLHEFAQCQLREIHWGGGPCYDTSDFEEDGHGPPELSFDIGSSTFAWDQLSCLVFNLNYLATDDMLDLLRACTHLEVLDFTDQAITDHPGQQPVVLSQLHTLKVSCPEDTLPLLRCPLLDTLHITDILSFDPATEFFAHSDAPIRTLRVDPVFLSGYDDAVINVLLASIPSLDRLEFVVCAHPTSRLRRLTRTIGDLANVHLQTQMVRVKTLLLSMSERIDDICSADTTEAIIALVDTYWKAPNGALEAFEFVAVGAPRDVAGMGEVPQLFVAFEQYRQQGLQVDVMWDTPVDRPFHFY